MADVDVVFCEAMEGDVCYAFAKNIAGYIIPFSLIYHTIITGVTSSASVDVCCAVSLSQLSLL